MSGKKTWFFPDGDLPPAGDREPKGHESLVVMNPSGADADISITVFYEDKGPETVEGLIVCAKRVRCFRLDQPLGQTGYQIPLGQYALQIEASTPVVCQMGRMDVRRGTPLNSRGIQRSRHGEHHSESQGS